MHHITQEISIKYPSKNSQGGAFGTLINNLSTAGFIKINGLGNIPWPAAVGMIWNRLVKESQDVLKRTPEEAIEWLDSRYGRRAVEGILDYSPRPDRVGSITEYTYTEIAEFCGWNDFDINLDKATPDFWAYMLG